MFIWVLPSTDPGCNVSSMAIYKVLYGHIVLTEILYIEIILKMYYSQAAQTVMI